MQVTSNHTLVFQCYRIDGNALSILSEFSHKPFFLKVCSTSCCLLPATFVLQLFFTSIYMQMQIWVVLELHSHINSAICFYDHLHRRFRSQDLIYSGCTNTRGLIYKVFHGFMWISLDIPSIFSKIQELYDTFTTEQLYFLHVSLKGYATVIAFL